MNERLIAAARGSIPVDLLLANARIVNVLNGEIQTGNVSICEGRIAGIGDFQAKEIIDLQGKYLAPGLIDGHVHLESSMLDTGEYARAVVPQGTLAIITDLHEIANVAGLDGIKYILDSARRLPLDLFLMAPSCVPATHLETSGAVIGTEEIARLLTWEGCIGLGEVMNFPGVLFADPALLAKIRLASGKAIDGHAPGLSGKDLQAYISAGIMSDHESVTLQEVAEKLANGMFIMIREGSSEKNLRALLPVVNDKTYTRCLFVVDDRTCKDILHDGDINAVVRDAVKQGLDPVRAIQMATINTARYFKLQEMGAIAPGYVANLIVFEKFEDMRMNLVFHRGSLVAKEGEPLFAASTPEYRLINTVKVKPFTKEAFRMKAAGLEPVIEVVPGQIVTRKLMESVKAVNGFVETDPERDILKLVVIERHKATGNIGVGLVKGFGLKKGALASSVAHDSHNIVVVGANDEDIFIASKEVERLQGGLVAAQDGKVLSSLPLPIAGLLSDQPLENVAAKLEELEQLARSMGSALDSPFAALSFLALPVIPELRLTDLGMVDVGKFELIKRNT